MQNKRITVVYATNEAYAPYAAVSIASLIANSSNEYYYDVYVFHTGLKPETVGRFKSMCCKNCRVTPFRVSRFIEKERKLLYTNYHFSVEMFYRILIPHILPECDKAIYIDCDTAILGDLSELFKTNIEDNVFGAVADVMHGHARTYVIETLGLDPDKYVNSGVLLINCSEFRRCKIKESFFSELSKRRDLRYPDQDLINLVCEGKIKLLERRWNYIWHYNFVHEDPVRNLPSEVMNSYVKDSKNPSILHFTGDVKPWNNKILPLSSHFWKYVDSTPFSGKIRTDYARIPNKEYITYRFIDFLPDGRVKLTASFQSLTGSRFSDVVLCVNGVEYSMQKTYVSLAQIAGRTYERSVFSFEACPDEDESLEFLFYSKNTGEEIPAFSGNTFPIEFSINAYITKNGFAYHRRGNALVISKATQRLVESLEYCLLSTLNTDKNDKLKRKALLVRRVYGLFSPMLKKDIWLISDRADSAGDNGETLFEYISANPIKGVKAYFVIDRNAPDRKRIKKLGRVVSPDTKRYKLLVLLSKRRISSQLEEKIMNPIICERYIKDILFNSKIVFLQHGIIKDDLSRCYNRFEQNMDIFVTSAKKEYESIAYNPAYGCGESVTKLLGLARFDKLENKSEKTIFILPTWRKSCLLNVTKGELAPDFTESEYFGFYNNLLHDEKLIKKAKETGYRLCFYAHHLMRKSTEYFLPLDPIFEDPQSYSYTDVFNRGALLITDYSSTQFDFAYLKKPIVYCQFDKDRFFSEHTYRAGYFDYECDGFGEVVYDVQSAVELIISYMENGCTMKEKYFTRAKDFFAYNDKNNCARTVKAIKNIK